LAAHKLVFEAPVSPHSLASLIALLDSHPDVAVVAENGAKTFVRDAKLDPWRTEITALQRDEITIAHIRHWRSSLSTRLV
jgi:predicted TIM-barrel fold metal-dependent hydrolase